MTKYLKIDKKKVAKALVTTLPIDSPAFYGNIPSGIYGKITRAEYERLCLVSARTANRELGVLFKKNLVEKKGKGPETYYVLARSGEIKEGVDKPYYLDGIAYKMDIEGNLFELIDKE